MKQFYNNIFAKSVFTSAVFIALVSAGLANAKEVDNKVAVKEISVKAVKQLMDSKAKNVTVLDANNAEARADAGVVPSAILLSSYNKYAFSELPKDKATMLIFYCYNSYCQASHAAADRAIGAGYKDARVMKEGIVGWSEFTHKAGV